MFSIFKKKHKEGLETEFMKGGISAKLSLEDKQIVHHAYFELGDDGKLHLSLGVHGEIQKFLDKLILIRFPKESVESPSVFFGSTIPEVGTDEKSNVIKFHVERGRSRGNVYTNTYSWLIQTGNSVDDYLGELQVSYN